MSTKCKFLKVSNPNTGVFYLLEKVGQNWIFRYFKGGVGPWDDMHKIPAPLNLSIWETQQPLTEDEFFIEIL